MKSYTKNFSSFRLNESEKNPVYMVVYDGPPNHAPYAPAVGEFGMFLLDSEEAAWEEAEDKANDMASENAESEEELEEFENLFSSHMKVRRFNLSDPQEATEAMRLSMNASTRAADGYLAGELIVSLVERGARPDILLNVIDITKSNILILQEILREVEGGEAVMAALEKDPKFMRIKRVSDMFGK